MTHHESDEPIHSYFGLSYANYLILTRTVLQSAPLEWQQRFVKCLEELEGMFPDEIGGDYWVRKRKDGKFVRDPLSDYERGRRKIPIKKLS